MTINIFHCERCGHDHKEIEMKKLTNPIEIQNTNGRKIEYWAICPNLNEPILIMLLEEV